MNCLNCEKEILKTDSNKMALGESNKILNNGEYDFIPCPYCNAKNILEVDTFSKSPVMAYKITRFEE
jgi:DNA-directed RNA polymerase subunit RPC12/RpoP